MTAYEMRISDWSSDVFSSDLAVLVEGGTQAGQRLDGGLAADALVGVEDHRVALALRDLDLDDLVVEQTVLRGAGRTLVRLGGDLVLRLAGEPGRSGVLLGAGTHRALVEGAEEAVVHHRDRKSTRLNSSH